MNLIIDVGNTRIKLAIYEDGTLQSLSMATKDTVVGVLDGLLSAHKAIECAIISSVGNFPEQALEILQNRMEVLLLTSDTEVPFQNNYSTPKTLGVDRIALVSAAATQYPNQNVLVIDAGSCITYDIITDKNVYIGGAISPGIRMRYQALHTFTANLPLLTPTLPISSVGDSTANAIHSGVLRGVVHETEGYIAFCRAQYPDFTIILTGGDAHLLRDSLKNSIFANPNFLLEGLLHILQHNT